MDLTKARSKYAHELEDALDALVGSLGQLERVKRISVFGSFARGRRDLFTDLDVLVVMDTDKP
ncbi:MAG: nucleotidyltransferase domain-containing protein, partial [Chloroflexi bacterium]|nr:nucleotidyltransferase domain-containing protein [Chloroflexota bacterium]